MKYNAKNNPRVIIVQKIYSHLFNNEKIIIFPKHRFKKFIKDVVNGTLERDEIINQEISNYLKDDVDLKRLDKVFQILLKSAIFENLYKPNVSKKVIIKEIKIRKKGS